MAETEVGGLVGVLECGLGLVDDVFQQGNLLVACGDVPAEGEVIVGLPQFQAFFLSEQVVKEGTGLVVVVAGEQLPQFPQEKKGAALEFTEEGAVCEKPVQDGLVVGGANEELLLRFPVLGSVLALEMADQGLGGALGGGHRHGIVVTAKAHVELGIAALEAQAEGAHAHDGALGSGRQGIHLFPALEDLGEGFVNELSDGLVLVEAQGNQVSGIDPGLFPEGLVLGGKLFPVGGEYVQFFGLGQHLVDEKVCFPVPGIAGAVPAIVADIEGLISVRGLADGSEFVQTVRAFHPVGFADIGLYFVQDIVLLGVEQCAG